MGSLITPQFNQVVNNDNEITRPAGVTVIQHYLRGVDMHMLTIDHRHISFFVHGSVGWSRLQNYLAVKFSRPAVFSDTVCWSVMHTRVWLPTWTTKMLFRFLAVCVCVVSYDIKLQWCGSWWQPLTFIQLMALRAKVLKYHTYTYNLGTFELPSINCSSSCCLYVCMSVCMYVPYRCTMHVVCWQ